MKNKTLPLRYIPVVSYTVFRSILNEPTTVPERRNVFEWTTLIAKSSQAHIFHKTEGGKGVGNGGGWLEALGNMMKLCYAFYENKANVNLIVFGYVEYIVIGYEW